VVRVQAARKRYRDSTNGALKYAYRPAGGSFGAPVTVDDAGNVGSGSSVAVDSAGRVHISYYDSTNRDLKYAQRPVVGSWSITTVDSVGDVGGITSLAVNGDGAHITYVDLTNTANTLKYARVCPSGLLVSMLDSAFPRRSLRSCPTREPLHPAT
jgi:hypothetical protein